MTAITQNLPWFVKDLGVAIIGEKCYTTLVSNLHITDAPCLKYSLSKGLGIGIVLGGSIMKVPQILLITSSRSARGLSLPSYLLETLSYGITLAYSIRNAFPFSTYGENAFLAAQNVLITLLIIAYAPPTPKRAHTPSQKRTALAATLVSALLCTTALAFIPLPTLTLLQLATLPLALLSKLPQIAQNHAEGSTGQLSAFAIGSQIAGCLARLFTTAQEVNDRLVLASFALALSLNLVLGAQLWLYWGKPGRVLTYEKNEVEDWEREKRAAEADHLNGRGLGGGTGYTTAKGTAASAIRERRASPASSRPSPAPPSAPALEESPAALPPPMASPVASPIALGSPIGTARIGTPPLRQGTPTGRKWSRKVD